MRRRLLWIVVAGLALVASPSAQHRTTFEQITIADTAIGITATITANMQGCAVRIETAQVRFRIDASPTASVGVVLDAGDIVTFDSIEEAKSVKFIRTGGVSAVGGVWCWSRE